MTSLGPAASLPELAGPIDVQTFAEVRAAGKPVILRGQVANWPLVAAAQQGDAEVVRYLRPSSATRSIGAIAAAPEEHGRFFYNSDVSGFNFHFGRGDLSVFLADLLRGAQSPDAPGMAMQSEDLSDLLPHVAAENHLALLNDVPPRIWIGNRIRVAPHYDLKENVACCVAGRRQFTVFPPDQTENLYPGPLELTPAGAPVSMVDLQAPDLDAYPRFAMAWETARAAVLEPGDAIYLPYCWWHGVDSLEAVSILVNYWWNESPVAGIGGAHDAMLHALLSIRHLPDEQRAVWRKKFDYYVFQSKGIDPAVHLPEHARGVLGEASPGLFERMRAMLRAALS